MDDLEAILETGSVAAVEVAASALAERGGQIYPCPNCGKPMIGAFCAVCGQARDVNRRSVWGLIKVLVEDIVSFDSRIMRTSWALVLRPGELASAFREGRTQRYLPALRLYLFVSLIFFLILGVTNIALMQLVVVATPTKITWINGQAYVPNPAYDKDDSDTQFMPKMMKMDNKKALRPGGPLRIFDENLFLRAHRRLSRQPHARSTRAPARSQRQRRDRGQDRQIRLPKPKPSEKTKSWIEQHLFDGLQRLVADPAALNGPMTTWVPRILFLLMPLYALLLALFYIRQRKQFYFVDHLIFSLTHPHLWIRRCCSRRRGRRSSCRVRRWPGATLAIAAVYGLIATRNFYRQNWFWTVVKFASISFFYVCFCVMPAFGAVMALSFLNV